MKKLFLLLFSFILIFTVPAITKATLFSFGPISDKGGTGTATMDINIVGNTLTAILNNTSPTTLDVGVGIGVNSTGITAFGFDLDPDTLSIESWKLTAYERLADNETTNLVIIGSSIAGTWDWLLTENGNTNGIKVDYVPNTNLGVQGALYNPGIVSGQAALPNYYTEAILTLNFNTNPTLDTTDDYSPFVRMQNVGEDGKGSLKLDGVPDGGGGGGDPIPEPASLILLGTGLLGTAMTARKKFTK